MKLSVIRTLVIVILLGLPSLGAQGSDLPDRVIAVYSSQPSGITRMTIEIHNLNRQPGEPMIQLLPKESNKMLVMAFVVSVASVAATLLCTKIWKSWEKTQKEKSN